MGFLFFSYSFERQSGEIWGGGKQRQRYTHTHKHTHTQTQTERKRERMLLSTGSFAKWPKQTGLGQAKARSQGLHTGLQMGSRGPSTWTMISCLFRYCIRSRAEGTPIQTPIWDAGITSDSLTCCTTLAPDMGFLFGMMKMLCNYITVMFAQLCKYTKNL